MLPKPRFSKQGALGHPPRRLNSMGWPLFRKTSRRQELSIWKNTPHGRWAQGPGSVDPRFLAGLPFPVPEILEFVAFCDSGNFSSSFPGTFLEFCSRTPEQTPETATAFSSCLTYCKKLHVLRGGRDFFSQTQSELLLRSPLRCLDALSYHKREKKASIVRSSKT